MRREQRAAGGGTLTMMIAILPYQNDAADFAAVDPILAASLPQTERVAPAELIRIANS